MVRPMVRLCGTDLPNRDDWGVLTHGIYALFCSEPERYTEFLILGMQHGFKYGGVWAGGTAIVLCCIRAHKEQKNKMHPK